MALDFVAIDWETANTSHASACQVGMVLVRGGRIAGSWATLIRPPPGREYLHPDNRSIHGLTSEDISQAPEFFQVWPEVLARIGSLPVVAHHAAFDTRVMRDSALVAGFDWPTLDYACSLVLTRSHLQLPEYTLPVCASALGVPLARHHEALADARACAQITLRIAHGLSQDTVTGLLQISSVRWGRISPDGYSPCRREKRRQDGIDEACQPALF